MPKRDRFALGSKCEGLTIEILEMLFSANAARIATRLELLQKIDLKLKILKTIIRLCFDVRAINEKCYLNLVAALVEIGRMLGGWIKKTTGGQTNPPT